MRRRVAQVGLPFRSGPRDSKDGTEPLIDAVMRLNSHQTDHGLPLGTAYVAQGGAHPGAVEAAPPPLCTCGSARWSVA